MIRRTFLAGAVLASALVATPSFADAVSDPGRPAADVARDAARKPADMIAFAGMKDGDVVLELLPGAGYFTRIFSKQVGAKGHLYAAVPASQSTDAQPAAAAIAAEPGHGNITVVPIQPLPSMPALDIIWTSQNYHDLHLTRINANMALVGKQWFGLLKPGGVLIVVDHAAVAGAPVADTADKLHRIDPAVVKSEMEAAGFVLDGESTVLRNADDAHTANVFDPAIRGKTDQFAYRFKKPM